MAELDPITRGAAEALCRDIEAVVNNHLGPAQQVLAPVQVGYILLKATGDLGRGAMLYALQTKLDERSPDEICDFVQWAIQQLLAGSRQKVLAKFAELSAAENEAG